MLLAQTLGHEGQEVVFIKKNPSLAYGVGGIPPGGINGRAQDIGC